MKLIYSITINWVIFKLFNSLLADNNFFEEGKKKYLKKNMMNPNFYFKEV